MIDYNLENRVAEEKMVPIAEHTAGDDRIYAAVEALTSRGTNNGDEDIGW